MKNGASENPISAYWYARDVIGGRWPEAEEIIKEDEYCWRRYSYHLGIKE